MSENLDPREELRARAARFNLDLDEVISQLRERLADEPTASEPEEVSIRLSDAAIRAAISDSYSPSEIGATDEDTELLGNSEVLMIGGRRRLRLSDPARRVVLQDAAGDFRYEEILQQALARDRKVPSAGDDIEAPSVWLRRFLSGTAVGLDGVSPTELRPAVSALGRLQGVSLPTRVTTLANAQRLLERAELLEPLRISIGALGDWDKTPTEDRFVGRKSELRQLRSFVDEIEAEGQLEALTRGIASLKQSIGSRFGTQNVPGVLMVVAPGGLGKSALMAKFVLDHALMQHRRFPFAYLDFDRAALQPRDPRHLLLEVTRQVGAQFPRLSGKMGDLREQIRRAIRDGGQSATPDHDPFDAFRKLLRDEVTQGERAVLIILDTMEIVQADPTAVSGVLAFVERMGSGGFTELRVVAAGRAEFPELLASTTTRDQGTKIELLPLSLGEAREMVQKLGTSLLGNDWKSEWTNRMAGKDSEPPERREPLSLRVAVEAMRDEPADMREELSLKIETLGEGADASFVGKLYQRRVLEHVRDEQVSKIAWPGLILRRVSVEIIRDFLAARCGVDPERAETVFNGLAREVWIVSRDGNTLRHVPELRARTLPLMRRYDATTFNAVNAAAIKYFGDRSEADPQARAEWIYHRLLGGEPYEQVDKNWQETGAQFLKDADQDFPQPREGDESGLGGESLRLARELKRAGDYLAARTSARLISETRLRRLSPRLALIHISRTAPEKGNLSDPTFDTTLAQIPLATIEPTDLSGVAETARTCLLVKTGQWTIRYARGIAEGSWHDQSITARTFCVARTAAWNPTQAPLLLAETLGTIDGFGRVPLGALIQTMAAARVRAIEIDRIDEIAARGLTERTSTPDATIGSAVLRVAIVFGNRSVIPATRLWLAQMTEALRANREFAFSSHEIAALGSDDEFIDAIRKPLESIDLTWDRLMSLASDPGNRTRLTDAALGPVVRDALRRRCDKEDIPTLRRLAAARDEDWIVPLAYAASRATNGAIPTETADFFDRHRAGGQSYLTRRFRSRPIPTDIVEILRRADEASDLAGGARLFAARGGANSVQDLGFLLDRYAEWRAAIDSILASPS